MPPQSRTGPKTEPARQAIDHDFHLIRCRAGDGVLYFAEAERTDVAAVIAAIASAQIAHPERVFAFNPAEGWARDVSEDIARAVAQQLRNEMNGPTRGQRDFIEDHCGVNTLLQAADALLTSADVD